MFRYALIATLLWLLPATLPAQTLCTVQNGSVRVERLVPVQRVPDVVQNVRKSIVRVTGVNGASRSIGSGVHIGNGLILTAAHVVNESRKFWIAAPGEGHSVAILLSVNKSLDVALLRAKTAPTTSASLAAVMPKRDSLITSAGYGRDGRLKWNVGRVESFTGTREITGMFWSGSSRQGDSGGPAFNEAGFVVGILSGTNHQSTHGTHVGKLWPFCKPWCERKPAPTPAPAPAPKPDRHDGLREQVAELKAEIDRLKKEKGPKGDPGAPAKVDYEHIVNELAKRAITVQIVDKDGNVKQQQRVYLGGTLRLRHRPTGESRRPRRIAPTGSVTM